MRTDSPHTAPPSPAGALLPLPRPRTGLFVALGEGWGAGRRRGYIALIAATLLALTLLAIRFTPHPPLRERAPYSHAFYSSDGALLRLTLASDEQYRVWTPLARIDPRLVDAVQLYEDRWFAWHPDFNPASLARGA